jgi:hypothetical protein
MALKQLFLARKIRKKKKEKRKGKGRNDTEFKDIPK